MLAWDKGRGPKTAWHPPPCADLAKKLAQARAGVVLRVQVVLKSDSQLIKSTGGAR